MFLPYEIEIPIRKSPYITYILIGVNTLLFLITILIGTERREIIFMEWGFIPEEWYRLYPLITSIFLHGGWMHLIGNMYFLWLFGQAVEDRLGSKKYILFYLSAGIFGNITHLLTIPPFFSDLPTIGASGAISGLLGAFIIMAPHATVKTFYFWLLVFRPLFGTFEIPAVLFIGGWFLAQLFYALSFSSVIGVVEVAFWAHVGGFLFGVFATDTPKIYQQIRDLMVEWKKKRRVLYAMTLAQERNWQKAIQILESLKPTSSELDNLNILLSQLYFLMGDTKKAKTLANTTLKNALHRKNQAQVITAYYILQNMETIEELTAHEYLILGRSFIKYKKTKEAEGILLEALKKFPKHNETDLILYELGDIYLHDKEYTRAREIYALFLKLYPDSKLYKSAEYCLHELEEEITQNPTPSQ